MWAFRRASAHLRNRGLSSVSARICSAKSETARCLVEPQEKQFGLLFSTRFYNTSSSSSKLYREIRTFSSQPDAKSNGEKDDELEDGFSELETPHDAAQESSSGDESDDTQSELEVLDIETNVVPTKPLRNRATSEMTKAIIAAPASSVNKVLDKWVEEGKPVDQTELVLTMLQLRKRRMFLKALQLSEWMESTKRVEYGESHYASRIDLIAKVRGAYKAEEYLKQVPESFRGEIVYRTLLANYVLANNVKKSEEVFNKMKSLKLPLTSFTCNQLLLLYKRADKTKIADVLLLMEKENIKPSPFTYHILISLKGQSNDISAMEEILETMKGEGIKPTSGIQRSVAQYYATSGLKDKAEAVLKEIEGDDITKNRWACPILLPIYASIGKTDEVDRIWKVCQKDTRFSEFMAAIEAFGTLKKIDKAELAFENMMKILKKPSSKHFDVLLKVYADNKMLAKGKDLVRRMSENGCNPGPFTWDAIVKLYVRAGEVEKADSLLEKAVKLKKGRPLFTSHLAVLDQYANRGDIHNAEKIFLKMRRAGYDPRAKQYQSLLRAYINAKAPAYGFSDRMKADNLVPNKALASQLAQADAFRKSAVAELLE